MEKHGGLAFLFLLTNKTETNIVYYNTEIRAWKVDRYKQMLKYNASYLRCPFFFFNSQAVARLLKELSTQDLLEMGPHIFLTL